MNAEMFERLNTPRLLLRKPEMSDAENIYSRYAADPEVTRLVGWPRHLSIASTRNFLEFSEAAWARWPVGPYLIESRENGRLLGSTGLDFETRELAMTGYVLAKDAWGNGFATEALQAMVTLARDLNVERLYALCHPDNRASCRVLEKGGFVSEGILPKFLRFPNSGSNQLCDVMRYAIAPKQVIPR